MNNAKRNKRLLRTQRSRAQRHALPSARPGEAQWFDPALQTPLIGFSPKNLRVAVDSPVLPTDTPEVFMTRARGFPSQALGPTFLSYGPMLAEGDYVIEEWESQIYGANGTIYNNQYLWVLRFENDAVVEMREYNDSHHAALVFGPLGEWPDLTPSTQPRRRSNHGEKPVLLDTELETAFEVVDQFELDPKMLADVKPNGAGGSSKTKDTVEGNKELILALRRARASGDVDAVNGFYAKGHTHFIGGERPFGWDHLPLEEIYAPLVAHLASPITVRYGPLIAEGNRVFEEMDSFARLDDGTVYNNWHAIVHEIRGGKIIQTREYHDPRHVWATLGRWAPWGKTAVEPRSSPRRSNLQEIETTIQYPTMFLELDRWKPFLAEEG